MTLFTTPVIGMLLLGYILGSVPFGLILSKLGGLGDIRLQGSGNIGATNVLRTGNKKLALATLVLDGLKGTLPVLVAQSYFSPEVASLAGLCAVIGHIFPIWLKCKGGKGVATVLGVVFAIDLLLGGIACAVWLAMFAAFRYSSLSALTAMAATAIAAYVLTPPFVFYVIACLSVLVIIRHHANIKRLVEGTEPRSSFKKQV